MKKNNIRSIRLVTSNYHMPRSMAEFRANNRGSDDSGASGLFGTGAEKLVAELAQLCSDRIGIQQVFIRVD